MSDAECHCVLGAFTRVTLVDRDWQECEVHGRKAAMSDDIEVDGTPLDFHSQTGQVRKCYDSERQEFEDWIDKEMEYYTGPQYQNLRSCWKAARAPLLERIKELEDRISIVDEGLKIATGMFKD